MPKKKKQKLSEVDKMESAIKNEVRSKKTFKKPSAPKKNEIGRGMISALKSFNDEIVPAPKKPAKRQKNPKL